MLKSNKINIILIIVSVMLAVALAGIITWRVVEGRGVYHAVFLRTGDLYFGRLTRFPTFGLKNVYFIQSTGDEANPLSIQKFTNVFWGPEDTLQINKKEVVWTAKIKKDSELARLLKENPDLRTQGNPQNMNAQGAPEATAPAPQQ